MDRWAPSLIYLPPAEANRDRYMTKEDIRVFEGILRAAPNHGKYSRMNSFLRSAPEFDGAKHPYGLSRPKRNSEANCRRNFFIIYAPGSEATFEHSAWSSVSSNTIAVQLFIFMSSPSSKSGTSTKARI